MSDVTRLLGAIDQGDARGAGELLPLVYQELRKLAAHKMAGQASGHTLQPTALVHEAWLRLLGNEEARFAGRAHFFAAAAEAMRHILIDSARRKQRRAARRRAGAGGHSGACRLPLRRMTTSFWPCMKCLTNWPPRTPQKAELTKLRYFVGMTFEEAAEVAGHFRGHRKTSLVLCARLALRGNSGEQAQITGLVQRVALAFRDGKQPGW